MARTVDPILVLYDDACPMCTFQSRVLGWLDWFDAIRLLPISSERAGAIIAPGLITPGSASLTRQELLEAIHCVEPGGRIHRGARAFRYLGMRMPLLVPLAVLLWVPGVIYIAERIYMWVSRNRHLLSRVFGCRQACAVMPQRKSKEAD